MKSIIIFGNELLAVTQWGSQYNDLEDQVWKDFDIDWTGMEGNSFIMHRNVQLMVLYSKDGDHLFAFSGPAGR